LAGSRSISSSSSPTFLWSQIAGGLLLGIGFVMAGYCPGTSVVGAVSGKLDAIFVLLGLFVGILFFEEIYSSLAGFYESAYLGETEPGAGLWHPGRHHRLRGRHDGARRVLGGEPLRAAGR
jgi:hypothetical protein